MRVFLPHLAGWNAARREAAARYAELGLGEAVELPLDEAGHVYHLFVVRTPDRERIAARATEAGIASASYYVTPSHLQPALRHLGYEPGSLPETERAAAENLALPMWGGIGPRRAGASSSRRCCCGRGSRPWRRLMRLLNRHRLWHVAVDGAPWRWRGGSRGTSASTRPGPATTTATSTGDDRPARRRDQAPVFVLSGFYNRWWRYVSTRDMWGAAAGWPRRARVYLVFTVFSIHRVGVPRGVWFIDLLLCLAFVAGVRLLARTLIERPLPGRIVARGKEALVVGAGDAAQLRRQGDAPHAGSSGTRRSGSSTTIREEEHPPARDPRARDDRRSAAAASRPADRTRC